MIGGACDLHILVYRNPGLYKVINNESRRCNGEAVKGAIVKTENVIKVSVKIQERDRT